MLLWLAGFLAFTGRQVIKSKGVGIMFWLTLRRLSSDNPEIRNQMIKTAKRTGYSQFLHRLVETLEVSIFSSSNRRAKAAKALGWLGEPMAIEPLVIALIDRSNVRSESVIALTKIDPNWRESIGAQKAIPALLKRLHLVPKSVAAQALVTLSKTKTLRLFGNRCGYPQHLVF